MESDLWQDWIAEHGAQLVLFACRWTLDQAEAEDVVQEAFVRFWRTRNDVRSPLAYLYKCVRSVAIDSARRRQAQRRREAHLGGQLVSSECWSELLEIQEDSHVLKVALTELPPEQAEVVTLKIWSELTFAQIADVTGAPVGTVASRYRYAIERLNHSLVKGVT